MSFNPFTQRCAICGDVLFFWQDTEIVPEGKVHTTCMIAKTDADQDKLRKEKRNAYERQRRANKALKSDEAVSIAHASKKGEGLEDSANTRTEVTADSSNLLPSKEQIEDFSKKTQ